MNIFLRELRANLKSLLIWSGIMSFLILTGFTKFSAFEGNPEMLEILDAVPPAMLEAFNLRAFNLTTVTGFYGVFFTYFALVLSISAVMWGSNVISKEERDRTVEFSLTLPVTRSKLITAKTLATLVSCIVLLFVTWGVTLLMAAQYNPESEFYDFVAISLLALFILQLIFLAVGVLLGCAMKQHKKSSSTAVSILLGTFFLSIFTSLSEDLAFLKYFSPFAYFNPGDLLHNGELDMAYVWLSGGIVVVALVGAYMTYSKRDLYI